MTRLNMRAIFTAVPDAIFDAVIVAVVFIVVVLIVIVGSVPECRIVSILSFMQPLIMGLETPQRHFVDLVLPCRHP